MPDMGYPGLAGLQGSMPSFSNLSQWMSGPGAVGGGNTVMGVNPPGGPMPGSGPGYAQPGPVMGMPGLGNGLNGPQMSNGGGPGFHHIINGPQMGTGMGGPQTGGNTGGNVDWHHILNGGGGPQTGTGNGPTTSPLAHAIMQLRSQGGGTPGVIGSYATANGGNVNPNPLMSANPMNRFNIPF